MRSLVAAVLALATMVFSAGCGAAGESSGNQDDQLAVSHTQGIDHQLTDSEPLPENPVTPTPEYTKSIEFPHLSLRICEDRGNKYEVKIKGNTAGIYAENPYEEFDGAVLCFDEDRIRSIKARVRYEIGFLQYLFDDKPAPELEYAVTTGWSELPVKKGSILNPQHYKNAEGVRTSYEQLGFPSYEAFSDSLERRHLENVRKESLTTQREFYAFQLNNKRKDLEECCPEYIEQAETFLKKDPKTLRSFRDLAVEPFISRTLIEIDGETKTGDKFTYYIADAYYWGRSL